MPGIKFEAKKQTCSSEINKFAKTNPTKVFEFFRKKTFEKEIFQTSFVDIHAHLIPGIDDGAKTLDNSVELLLKMGEFGIQNFVATPHVMAGIWNNTSKTILEGRDMVRNELKKRDLSHIRFDAAAEYMLDEQFRNRLKHKDLLTLGENHLLVEMSYLNAPVDLFETLFDIQMAGYQPILAHPERYLFYHSKFSMYQKLKTAGCLFQLNLLSLTGYYGNSIRKTAIKLLKGNLIDLVGTDTHHLNHLEAMNLLGSKKNLALLEPIFKNNAALHR